MDRFSKRHVKKLLTDAKPKEKVGNEHETWCETIYSFKRCSYTRILVQRVVSSIRANTTAAAFLHWIYIKSNLSPQRFACLFAIRAYNATDTCFAASNVKRREGRFCQCIGQNCCNSSPNCSQLAWGYSSVAELPTADRRVPSSNLGAPYCVQFLVVIPCNQCNSRMIFFIDSKKHRWFNGRMLASARVRCTFVNRPSQLKKKKVYALW